MTYGQQPQMKPASDDLTLRDLVHAVRDFRREAMRFWWLYAIAFFVIGGFMLYRVVSAPVTYTAEVTFMVNEDEGGALGGVSGVLGQLGLGRARAGGRYNLDKIIELAKSRKIVTRAMFTAPDSNTFLANRLIEEYALDEKWAKYTPEMKGFRFTHDSVEIFNEQERNAMLSLHAKLIGGEKTPGMVSATFNDLSGILSLTCESTDEQLSIDFATAHFYRLGEFYINQAIERQEKTYQLVRAKVDSISAELSGTDVSLARYSDASNNLFSRVDQVKGQRLQRDLLKLSAMQAEAVKNMELAEFMLKNARPVIQELDLPISPLQPMSKSKLKALILGALIAFVVVTLYVIGRKIVRNAMVETRE